MEWFIVSKAAVRLSKIRMLRECASEERRRSFVTLIRAFCAVLGSETRLKWFVEMVGVKVGFDLRGYGAFQYF